MLVLSPGPKSGPFDHQDPRARRANWMRVHSISHATSDGLRIAYAHAGSGPPILFLHGVGSVHGVWRRQILSLAPSFQCIALDYRGYGDSDVPPPASLEPDAHDAQSISREAFARDAFAVLDACGLASAHLCGCSLGGVVALECYRQSSERVRSLILVDTFAHFSTAARTVGERIATLDSLGIDEFARTRAPGVLHPQAPPARVETIRAQMGSIPLAVYKAATRVTWTGDYRDLLPRIAAPVLVIWGERDTIAPYEFSAEIAYSLRTPQPVVVVPNAGHLPNVDNPEFFDRAVSTFVAQVSEAT